jgi:hypothetical protein
MSEPPAQSSPGRRVDFEEARRIAQRAQDERDPDGRMIILDDKTQERNFGWAFAFTTRKFLETGDFRYTVPGAGPLVVFRHDGSVEFLTSSLPPERLFEDIEERWEAGEFGRKAESGEPDR